MDPNLIIKWLILGLVVLVLTMIIPGIKIKNFLTALLVSLGLVIAAHYLEPAIMRIFRGLDGLVYLLINFVVNALMILLISAIVPGFKVKDFLSALFLALGLALIFYIFPMINI
ncbi:MAG: hypothetical protein GF332_04145 [Candidatus Moranbacteria bacterium]|nr:hypothetical protein [Candidatus Moranbacteria bacterium]